LRKRKAAASLASIAALALIAVLGLSYFSHESGTPEGGNQPNTANAPEKDVSNENDDANNGHAEGNKDKDEIRNIVDTTLQDMNAEIDDIVETHNEWFATFRPLDVDDETFPDEFYDAVN